MISGVRCALDLFLETMVHGYFKIGNISCSTVLDRSIFMNKLRVSAISMAFVYLMCAIYGHLWLGEELVGSAVFNQSFGRLL